MVREHLHRAELVEDRFQRLQQERVTEPLAALYAEGPKGLYTLSREVLQIDNRKILRHTMALEERKDGAIRQAVMENGSVTSVEGYGELEEGERDIYAQGLFHALRYYDFTSVKPEGGL